MTFDTTSVHAHTPFLAMGKMVHIFYSQVYMVLKAEQKPLSEQTKGLQGCLSRVALNNSKNERFLRM